MGQLHGHTEHGLAAAHHVPAPPSAKLVFPVDQEDHWQDHHNPSSPSRTPNSRRAGYSPAQFPQSPHAAGHPHNRKGTKYVQHPTNLSHFKPTAKGKDRRSRDRSDVRSRSGSGDSRSVESRARSSSLLWPFDPDISRLHQTDSVDVAIRELLIDSKECEASAHFIFFLSQCLLVGIAMGMLAIGESDAASDRTQLKYILLVFEPHMGCGMLFLAQVTLVGSLMDAAAAVELSLKLGGLTGSSGGVASLDASFVSSASTEGGGLAWRRLVTRRAFFSGLHCLTCLSLVTVCLISHKVDTAMEWED